MRKARWAGLAILVTATGLVVAQDDEKQQKKPQPQPPPAIRITTLGQGRAGLTNSLQGRIAAATKLPEADVAKMIDALGPSIRDLLGQGQTVNLPNLGSFRVVRIPEHKDMVNGRPATIAGSNYVEFNATGDFTSAANQPGVKPAETVPPFEYHPLPDQTKGLKAPYTRTPSTRTP
jgi:nucleoid DNA-binding protein